jgi:phage FluMu protein gp41
VIEDELQYQITQEEVDRFAQALAEAETEHVGRPPEAQMIIGSALASELEVLREQIAEYEARTGRRA